MSSDSFKLLADENFNGRILRALQRRLPELDVLRAQDTELYTAQDPSLLEGAAKKGRILLSHDRATLVGYAHERVKAGLPMPGVLAVTDDAPIGRVIEDLILLFEAGSPAEVESRVLFVPL